VSALHQILAVTFTSLRSLPNRLGSSCVTVIGMAGVVAVIVSVLSMSSGFLESVGKTGRADRAIVTQSGAQTESLSSVPRSAIPVILNAAGIKKDSAGHPIVSADIFAYQLVPKSSDGLLAPVTIHGVGPQAFTLLPQIKLISGRVFTPGLRELIVGRMMASQFVGLQVGSTVALSDGDWSIVGSFESDGDQHESELLGDVEALMSAQRRTSYNSMTVMLDSANAFGAFSAALTTNPALNVDVVRENGYFAKLAKPVNDFLTLVAVVVGAIMGLGAAFGALNTMYSAVSTRATEIATLRAIGFGGGPVVVAVLTEALLLSLVGAFIGVTIAWLFFNGTVVVSDYYIYTLTVKPSLIVLAIACAVAIGLFGGLLPATRAARLRIAVALRPA
jgi:putative ABC transport system permease protein